MRGQLNGSLPPGETSPKSRFATAVPPWVPGYQMSRMAGTLLRRPAQVERAAVEDQQHHRRAGRRRPPGAARAGAPGSSSEDREAASPIMFCHSPTTTTATSAACARSTARCSSASSSKPSGSTGRCRGTCRTSRQDPLGRPDARRIVDHATRRRRGPRMPSSTVTVSSRSKSKHHGPNVSRLGVGERADDGDRRRPSRQIQRQEVALVAQQDRRSLGGDAGNLAVGRVAQHLAGPVLVDVRVVEQAQPDLGLEHASYAHVEGGLRDGTRSKPLLADARTPGH